MRPSSVVPTVSLMSGRSPRRRTASTRMGSTAQGCRRAAESPLRMERGLYIAASGMLAEQTRQDLLANDLANTSTAGYKSDRATQRAFEELLLRNTESGAEVGPLGTGVAIDRQATDWRPMGTRQTSEPL